MYSKYKTGSTAKGHGPEQQRPFWHEVFESKWRIYHPTGQPLLRCLTRGEKLNWPHFVPQQAHVRPALNE